MFRKKYLRSKTLSVQQKSPPKVKVSVDKALKKLWKIQKEVEFQRHGGPGLLSGVKRKQPEQSGVTKWLKPSDTSCNRASPGQSRFRRTWGTDPPRCRMVLVRVWAKAALCGD